MQLLNFKVHEILENLKWRLIPKENQLLLPQIYNKL